MNLRLLAKHLGTISLLIGAAMCFSLPWAWPMIGVRNGIDSIGTFEFRGFRGLMLSIIVCTAIGFLLKWLGRRATGKMFRREAMAVVGLSWVLATVIGGLPYWFGGTYRGPSVRLNDREQTVQLFAFHRFAWGQWLTREPLDSDLHDLVAALLDAQAVGLSSAQLKQIDPHFRAKLIRLLEDADWSHCLLTPDSPGPRDRIGHYRIRWIQTSFIDAMFESQSGFSTTGATVFSQLEDPYLLPHCLLFWRSSTHFLGGLGIIVLFVVILGHGSAGKAMMRAEVTAASGPSAQSRTQHVAWTFAALYGVLNLLLTIILRLNGLTWFDSLCHAFGTLATGGFSTYNASVGHFRNPVIHYTIIGFMVVAGMNFSLLYSLLNRRFREFFGNLELRAYLTIIAVVATLIAIYGYASHDFDNETGNRVEVAARHSLFQVVSIITTTGFATHDFDRWNHFGRGALLLLMFIGGCAGSTGGGPKVVRHVLLMRILLVELEQTFRPNVVRPLYLDENKSVESDARREIPIFFCFVFVLLIGSFLFIIMFEPDSTWGHDPAHKLLDGFSAVVASLSNVGPGLGTVGATQNFGHFSSPGKLIFIWLMMLGRVEIFAILTLFVPGFWRNR